MIQASQNGAGHFLRGGQAIDIGDIGKCSQVALVYVKPDDTTPNGEFPFNPNGSTDDIAGVCDATCLVFGLMPHPERASAALLGSTDGLVLLRSLVNAASARAAA